MLMLDLFIMKQRSSGVLTCQFDFSKVYVNVKMSTYNTELCGEM